MRRVGPWPAQVGGEGGLQEFAVVTVVQTGTVSPVGHGSRKLGRNGLAGYETQALDDVLALLQCLFDIIDEAETTGVGRWWT